jgi:hypothetical protein
MFQLSFAGFPAFSHRKSRLPEAADHQAHPIRADIHRSPFSSIAFQLVAGSLPIR